MATSSSTSAAAPPRGVVCIGTRREALEARWRQNSVRDLDLSPLSASTGPVAAIGAAAGVGAAAAGGATAGALLSCRRSGQLPSQAGSGSANGAAEPPGTVRLPPTAASRFGAWEDWPGYELANEEEEGHVQGRSNAGRWSVWWLRLQGWILAIAIGVFSSLSGAMIDVGVDRLSSTRFGWCHSDAFAQQRSCPHDDWKGWGTGHTGILLNVSLGVVMAFCSASLVFWFAKAAAGSGIPEVKTILGGFVMPDVTSVRTLVVKIPSLCLSVAAGLSLGKEGPLVHVAVCWAQLFSGIFEQFSNEGKRRELISAAAAAGVSTAFGAPLGGVLFSLEEVSSMFPAKTLIRAFTASVTAALVLALIRGPTGLTLFSVRYDQSAHTVEYVAFALLGLLGGLLGALFNGLNVRVSAIRMKPGYRVYINGITEVTLIALFTLLSSWPLGFTRLLSSDVIHALFQGCDSESVLDARSFLGLCTASGDLYAPPTASLVLSLLAAGFIRLAQSIITFGTACPAGLFVPSLYVGACFGRVAGMGMRELNLHYDFLPGVDIQPGVYAMVGASAMLGGVCRVTISLVAIMLELTGSMSYIVPFMMAVLIAKIVGDAINEGIYDLYVVLKGYPFLPMEVDVTFDERCCDIMEVRLITLDVALEPSFSDVRTMLQEATFRGFPVTSSGHFVGYAKRSGLEALLANQAALPSEGRPLFGPGAVGTNGDARAPLAPQEGTVVTLDMLLPYVDTTVMRMVPDASLGQVHKTFKQLGIQNIFIVGSKGHDPTQDVLQGILSKNKFLMALKSGAVGHRSGDPTLRSFHSLSPRNPIVARLQSLQRSSAESFILIGGRAASETPRLGAIADLEQGSPRSRQ